MKKISLKISYIIISLIILSSIIFSVNNNINAEKAYLLPCCNNWDPRDWPTYNQWSWICYQNGQQQELIISWSQCFCAWAMNNFNPPIGMACSVLQMCGDK